MTPDSERADGVEPAPLTLTREEWRMVLRWFIDCESMNGANELERGLADRIEAAIRGGNPNA
jgi:hypothetical protein